MEKIEQKFKDIKKSWDENDQFTEDLSIAQYPQLTKSGISKLLSDIATFCHQLLEQDKNPALALVQDQIKKDANNMLTYATTHFRESNRQAHLLGFVEIIKKVYLTLTSIVAIHTDKPFRAGQELANIISELDAAKKLTKEASEIQNQIQQIQKQANDAIALLKTNEEKSNTATSKTTAAQQQSEALQTKITETSTAIEALKTNTGKNAAGIEQLRKDCESLLGNLKQHNTNLTQIIETSKEQQKAIQQNIDDSSRLGMAGSFNTRKSDLTWPMVIWGLCFFLGIAAMIGGSYKYLLPLLDTETIPWPKVVVRVALFSPFVWFTWFSAVQYGYILRLREDYSFKYASAMAFEGYKKQASAINHDLLRLLMELSIVNFAQNPIRIFDSKTNFGSPFEQVTKETKGILEKLKGFFGH